MRDGGRRARREPPPPPKSYTEEKAGWELVISAHVRRVGIKRQVGRVLLEFQWAETNAKRDPDGIASGGRKLILDALVKAGVLDSDRHEHVVGFVDTFETDADATGVCVCFRAVDIMGEWYPAHEAVLLPFRLPDLNELLQLRETSARRSARKAAR